MSLLAIAADVLSIFGLGSSHVTGIKHGKKLNEIINVVRNNENKIQRISDKILIRKDEPAIINLKSYNRPAVNNFREINQIFSPVADVFDGQILTNVASLTPPKVQQAFKNSPRKVLDYITPIDRVKRHSNPDMIPFLFFERGMPHIGWQMKGVLPLLFDFEINPNSGLFTPRKVKFNLFEKDFFILKKDVGIETMGGEFTPIIERGKFLPFAHQSIFSTASDNQPSVELHVLEGNNTKARSNRSVGRFIFDSIPPAPKGVPQIEVAVSIDGNGKVTSSARDLGTGKYQSKKMNSVEVKVVSENNQSEVIPCPFCSRLIRIPNTKTINATCPKCREKFKMRNSIILGNSNGDFIDYEEMF